MVAFWLQAALKLAKLLNSVWKELVIKTSLSRLGGAAAPTDLAVDAEIAANKTSNRPTRQTCAGRATPPPLGRLRALQPRPSVGAAPPQ